MFDQLTRIDTNKNLLKRAYILWKQEDSSLSMIAPLIKERLLKFEVNSGWSGFIDLQQWFSATYPKLATLSANYVTDEQLYVLFVNHDVQIVIPELPIYKSLLFEEITSMAFIQADELLPSQHCFSIDTEKGKLWITKLLESHVLDKKKLTCGDKHIVDVIPLFLKFSLGKSKISLGLFRKIKPGDILLIQEATNTTSVNSQVIGNYRIENEGIMIDLHNLDLADQATEDKEGGFPQKNSFDRSYENYVVDQNAAKTSKINYKNVIPVKLSFVLDQKKIKLAELEAISEGQILPLLQDCYKSIEIEANGVPVAKGEMVIVDEQMAVEVKAIYGESAVK